MKMTSKEFDRVQKELFSGYTDAEEIYSIWAVDIKERAPMQFTVDLYADGDGTGINVGDAKIKNISTSGHSLYITAVIKY